MEILAPISPGELIDKLTILEIKLSQITDEEKLKNVRREYELLREVCDTLIPSSSELDALKVKILEANKKIWESENDVRAFWDDDVLFNKGAKQSHFYNDERSKVKRRINELLGSTIIEEKSHPKYKHQA